MILEISDDFYVVVECGYLVDEKRKTGSLSERLLAGNLLRFAHSLQFYFMKKAQYIVHWAFFVSNLSA